MGKFVIRTSKNGVRFHLNTDAGQTIAVSEMYKSDMTCRRGIQSVCRNAGGASLEDQTIEGHLIQINPKFEVYQDKAGQFRFRLKARNGQIIAASNGYDTREACMAGVESVRRNVRGAAIEEDNS